MTMADDIVICMDEKRWSMETDFACGLQACYLNDSRKYYITNRAETNTQFIQIFAWLHKHSSTNTKRIFGCTYSE